MCVFSVDAPTRVQQLRFTIVNHEHFFVTHSFSTMYMYIEIVGVSPVAAA